MKKLTTEYYRIQDKKIPEEFDGVKIAYLTDLHNVCFGLSNQLLLDRIEKEAPDYVFLGGDMLVGKREFEPEISLSLGERLAMRYPTFMGLGNHEQKLGLYEETREDGYPCYRQALEKAGITVLDNDSVFLERGCEKLRLYGLSMDYRYYGKWWRRVTMEPSYLTKTLGDCDTSHFSILLAHNPKYFESYAKWGANLILSGHVHGGIVILPKLGGVIAPDYVLFPKYDFGYFKTGNSQLVLSRGLGMHTIRLRLFNPPELSVITLKKQNEK